MGESPRMCSFGAATEGSFPSVCRPPVFLQRYRKSRGESRHPLTSRICRILATTGGDEEPPEVSPVLLHNSQGLPPPEEGTLGFAAGYPAVSGAERPVRERKEPAR